jgi:uncharacterized protein
MFANLRALLALLSLTFFTCLPVMGEAQAAEMAAPPAHHRVVFEVTVNDQHRWNGVFGNFRNIQAALGPQNVDIEMVVHGDAIGMLRWDSLVADKVAEALANGVKVVACENSMKGQKLSHDDMLPNIGYVPAGIVEIIRLQEAGWTYIKP